MLKLKGALIALSILSISSLAQAGQRTPLSSKALNTLFPGQFQAVVKGYKIRIIAKPGGTLLGRYSGLKDEGTWRISNGQLCIFLKKWMKGKTACSRVVVDGRWYRAKKVKFRKANSLALAAD